MAEYFAVSVLKLNNKIEEKIVPDCPWWYLEKLYTADVAFYKLLLYVSVKITHITGNYMAPCKF